MDIKAYSRRQLMTFTPYDAEIEYLQVESGFPYMDTGIIGNSNLNYEIKFGYKRLSGSYPYVFGAQQGDRARRFSLMISSYANYTLIVNDGANERNITFSSGEANNPLIVKKENHDIYINGNKKYTFPNSSYTTPVPITMFVCNTPTGIVTSNNFIGLPFYYIKIGNLHLIPVRKGNEGFLYDKVSGQLFGNEGTGNFILGPDI